MKLSFIVTVFDEVDSLKEVLKIFSKHIVDFTKHQLIFVLDSNSSKRDTIVEHIDEFYDYYTIDFKQRADIIRAYAPLVNGDADSFKNKAMAIATGSHVVMLHVTDVPNEMFFKYIDLVIESNPHVDIFNILRKETVHGITTYHLKEYGWTMNEDKFINYPSYSPIVIRNDGKQEWSNKKIINSGTIDNLPESFYVCINKTVQQVEAEMSY